MVETQSQVKPTSVDKAAHKVDKAVDKFMNKTDKITDKFVDKMDKADPGTEDEITNKFMNKMDKAADRLVDKVDKVVTKLGPNDVSEDQDVASYRFGGDAFAVGDETFTTVDSTSTIVNQGAVTEAEINIKATAVAEGGSTYASADTRVESNFDVSLLIKFEEGILVSDGVSYDISNAKFIGIDFPDELNLSGEANHKIIVIERDGNPDWDPDLYGNVAMFSIDAKAVGDTTYLSAEAAALTTDTISISEINIDAAVA